MGLSLTAPEKVTNAGLGIQAARWDFYEHVFVVLGYGPYFDAASRLYFGDHTDGQLEYIETEYSTLTRQQFGDVERGLTPINFRHGRFGSLRRSKRDDMSAQLVQRLSGGRILNYLWRPTTETLAGAEEVPPVDTLPHPWGNAWDNARLILADNLETLDVTLPLMQD